MKKLMYIVFFLFMAANLLAQETYVIDSVCVGAERTYRRDGEAGYTYDWFIQDKDSNTVANPIGVDVPIDTIWGNEFDYQWLDTGTFYIRVEVYSEHNCDTIELGQVKVYPDPGVAVPDDKIVCALEDIIVSGDTAWNYSVMFWETRGDGSFSNDEQLHPTYYLGFTDSTSGTVTLVLTAWGMADNETCVPAVDSVTYFFSNPEIDLQVVDVLCYGDSTAWISTTVTNGISPYDYSWTGPDGYTADSADISGLKTGEYILTVIDANGCVDIDTAIINEPTELLLSIDSIQEARCFGYSDGFVNASASGGTPPYSFDLAGSSQNGSNVVFNTLSAGKYELILTDANGCVVSDSVEIKEPEELLADLYPDDSTICETEITRIQADPDGGTGDYTHLWTGSGAAYLDRTDTTVVYFGTAPPDTYQLIYTLTDENSCITGDTIEIVVNPLIVDTIYISLCANALPYVWEGDDYFTTGQYIDTLVGTVGCDTIRILDLFIEPMEEDTIYVSLCANQLPYNWLGTDYDAAGQYIDTIPGQIGIGCDTIRMLDLFIEPMEEDTIYVSLCANQLPYNWLGTDYDAAGQYIDTIPGQIGIGCDTIRMLDLFIEPMEEDTIYVSLCANQLPYNWLGTDYDAAGQYIDTIPGQIGIGCDTIRMLDLFIEPMEEDTIYVSLCANQLPYNWLGTDYDAAGQYIDTIPGQIGIGCDTIRMLDLFIEPMEEDTIYVSLCANQLPYNWLGTDYDAAGQYIDTIPGQIGIGCDTIRMLDLFIEPMEEDTIYVSLCANQLPYNWLGTDYDAAGQYIDTIPGQIGMGCDTIRMLDLFIEPMEEDTIYVSLCANQLPYNWLGTDYDAAGHYIDTIPGQIGIGCDTIRMLDLFIEPMEEDTIYVSLCANQLPYNWLGTDYDAAGQYIDTIPGQIGMGCDTIRMLDLFIEPMEEDTIYVSLCANQLPYNWLGTDYDAAGQYIDTIPGQIGIGCDTIRMLDLFIEPMEEDTIYASICANELPYNWLGTDYLGEGLYTDTISGLTDGGCDTIRVLDLQLLPDINDTIYASICANELPYNWLGTDYLGEGLYTDTISGLTDGGCDTIRVLDLQLLPDINDTIYASICANELPYNWLGTDYLVEGLYTDTISGLTGGGCDTIRVLDLQLLPDINDTIYASICANELPYNWLGTDYLVEGLYTDTISGLTGGGCDTIRVLDLQLLPDINDTIYASICANELPYNWLGTDYLGEGLYTDTISGLTDGGCDTIRVLDLQLLPDINDTIYASICANELPYNWLGTDYLGEGLYTDTISGLTGGGCDTIRVLDLQLLPDINDTIYASICANELPYNWLGTDYLGEGLYTDTISGLTGGGCDTIRVLDLQLLPDINDTIYASICANELPYNWLGTDYLVEGLYTDTISGLTGGGCDTIRVLDLQLLPDINDTIYASICANELPYNWLGTDYLGEGLYTDTISGLTGGGCDTIRVLDLQLLPDINDTIYASICANELPYNWLGTDYLVEGLYTDTISGLTGGGCDTIRVLDLQLLPDINDTIYASICANELPYNWLGTDYLGEGLYTDTISGLTGGGCDTIRVLDLQLLPDINDTIYASICANELPYNWLGTDYLVEGLYTDTISGLTGGGCDTIRVLDLQLLPDINDTIYASICANELPYNWLGTDYLGEGLYTDTISGLTGGGCDTIRVLSLEVGPLDSILIDTFLCYGDPTEDWNGYEISSTADSTYQADLKNSFGCDSIVTLNVSILPVTYSFTDTTIFDSDAPFVWNSNPYDTTGIYVDTTINTVGCDSIMTLDLEILYGTKSHTWDSVCESVLPYEWNGEFYDTTGTYFVVLPNANAVGADSTAYVHLTVWETTYGTLDTGLCEPELPFVYLGKEYTAEGTYTDTLVNAKGCDSILTITLEVWPVEEYAQTLDICTSDLPYPWQGMMLDSAGTYNDTMTTQYGCDSVLTLSVTINEGFSSDSTAALCYGNAVADWEGQTISSIVDSIYTRSYTTVTECDSTLTLTVSINLPDTITITITADSTEVNEGETVLFTSTVENEGSDPIYAWYVNDIEISGETSSTFSYIPQDGDSVYATLISDLECAVPVPAISNRIMITVNTKLALKIDALPLNVLCYGESSGAIELSVTGGSGNYAYNWTGPDNFTESVEDVSGLGAGMYTVIVTDTEDQRSLKPLRLQ